MNLKNYLQELKRRNVFKSALAYIVGCWVIIQVLAITLPLFNAPQYVLKTILLLLVICFPIWLIFSWIYEVTPDGLKKTVDVEPTESITTKTSVKLNKIILAALCIAIVLLAVNIFKNPKTDLVRDDKSKVIVDKDRSIAVLAFADMSPLKDQEYFSDGISEEILNLLVKIPNLKVISRTSSFSFKGKDVTTTEIGKTLHVNHILEGSIRKSGNTLRITAQLIDVSTGTHVWSETYDRPMDDIFKIQDEIAAAVTQQLKVSLMGQSIASKKVEPEAYNLYLKAKQLYDASNRDDNIRAEQLLKESIAIDSTYAPSWVLLSTVYFDSGLNFAYKPIKEATISAIAAAKKAIRLDPNYAYGYARLSKYHMLHWDFEASNINLQKALQLAPNDANVIREVAINYLNLGYLEKSITMLEQSIEQDPLNYLSYYNLSLTYAWNEQYNEAEQAMNTYLQAFPNSDSGHNFMSLIYLGQRKVDKAHIEIEKSTDPFWSLYRKCMIVYAAGDKKKADRLLNGFLAEYSIDSWPNIAHVYAFRGDKNKTFEWLDKAYSHRDTSLLEVLNYPEMKYLWGDPRWNKFIKKLGLPKNHGFHLD